MRALAWLAAVVLAGCASTGDLSSVRYQPVGQCVDGLADVPAAPVTVIPEDGRGANRPKFVKIHEAATCVREGSRARPVLLYTLRDLPVPSEISVTVEAAGLSRSAATAVFAPSVVILDRELRAVKRYTLKDFDQRGFTYTLVAFLNEESAREGYLLVEPDAEQVGKTMEHRVGVNTSVTVATMYGGFTWVDGDELQRTSHLTDVGRVAVSARAHDARSFEERNRR
jgi:hypothetical protein